MFAEEEWTDSPSADGSDQAVVNLVSSAPAKDKVVGKRSLLRTLQTLGSVPDWEGEKPFEDSDEEKESSSAPNKTKKKRCKKRRRSSNVAKEEEQNDQVDSPETPVKKKRPMKKINKETASSEMSLKSRSESAKGAPSEKDGNQPEQNLSRKQWKNRMKNKRRCKNKYQEKTTADDNTKAKEEPLQKSKDVKATQTSKKKMSKQKNPKMSKKLKNIANVKNGISVHDDAENHKNSSMSSNHLQSKSQTADDCVSSSEVSQKVGDEGKPSKMMKKSQIQAEKLRRVLMLHHTDDNDGDKKKKEECNNNTVELKCDAEQTAPDRSSALRSKMEKRLEAARFRHINEQLYTSTSGEAKRMFQQDPDAIGIYHRGYTAQVQHWPENPVDSIISYIRQRPASLVVADFGCGDCKIARSVKNKVHSFDLAPVCELAIACDMAKVPLQDSSVDVAIFCLSLMGTNLGDFLKEANRVLVMGGVLKIAEVASRFDDVRSFIGAMSSLGFKINNKDTENSHFYSFEFIKTRKAPENVKKPGLELKPCLYKKR